MVSETPSAGVSNVKALEDSTVSVDLRGRWETPTLAIPVSILNQLDGLKDSIFAVTLPSHEKLETEMAGHLFKATQ